MSALLEITAGPGTAAGGSTSPSEYLRPPQLARETQVSLGTVKGWLRAGLPHLKVRRTVLIHRGQFTKWISQYQRG